MEEQGSVILVTGSPKTPVSALFENRDMVYVFLPLLWHDSDRLDIAKPHSRISSTITVIRRNKRQRLMESSARQAEERKIDIPAPMNTPQVSTLNEGQWMP